MSFALVIKLIPEQAEDIYWILIDLKHVAVLEIPRSSDNVNDATAEIADLNPYREKRESTETKRRFDVAIALMKEYLSR